MDSPVYGHSVLPLPIDLICTENHVDLGSQNRARMLCGIAHRCSHGAPVPVSFHTHRSDDILRLCSPEPISLRKSCPGTDRWLSALDQNCSLHARSYGSLTRRNVNDDWNHVQMLLKSESLLQLEIVLIFSSDRLSLKVEGRRPFRAEEIPMAHRIHESRRDCVRNKCMRRAKHKVATRMRQSLPLETVNR